MTSPPLGVRRSLLRSSTAECHRDVEAAMESRNYFASGDAYREYLLRLELFYRRFYAAMGRAHSDLLNRWSLRDHQTWLAADLSHLGLKPLRPDHNSCWEPRIDTRAAAFGATYVVLGSSLGARVLASRAARLQFTRDAGGMYLASHEASNAWRRFLADLEAHRDLSAEDLVQGARRTFASYKANMIGTVAA